MELVATGSSVIGPAHQQDNSPNQDAVMVRGVRRGWCIAVADGLGSRPLSHLGSQLAVRIVRATVKELCQPPETSVLLVNQHVKNRWLKAFTGDHFSYETTCLWAWVDSHGRGCAAQAGDGVMLIRCNGKFRVLTPERDGFGNQTLTLAQAKESDWVTSSWTLTTPGDGILLMTDGISDDLLPEHLEGFFDIVFRQLKKTNKSRCKRWLTRELTEWTTPKHGDDKSIAGIFRIK